MRKLFLFESLDILEGLSLGPYEQLCDYLFLEDEIQELEDRLPAQVAQLLLPRCRQAIEGLRSLGAGFLPERRQGDQILVTSKKGPPQAVGENRAIGSYLWSVRNGTHSYRGTVQRPRALSLLAGHTGEIPDPVADLSALHFLRIFSNPARVLFRRKGCWPTK